MLLISDGRSEKSKIHSDEDIMKTMEYERLIIESKAKDEIIRESEKENERI